MKAFSPQQIEQELLELQRQASPLESRTTLFNLIVYSSKKQAPHADRLLRPIFGKRAARVIHIAESDDLETSVEVSARCRKDALNRAICFQEIHIRNGKDNAGTAPGTWTSLLIRDLPVHVLWLGNGDAGTGFRHLEEQADKIIFDSDQMKNPVEQLTRASNTHIITDLAWLQWAPLRKAMAREFQKPAARHFLTDLKKAEIRTEKRNFYTFFRGWLEASLESIDQLKHIEINSLPAADNAAQHSMAFELSLHSSSELFRLQLNSQGCISVTSPWGSHQGPCSLPDKGTLLLQSLDSLIPDYLLLKILKNIQRLEVFGGIS